MSQTEETEAAKESEYELDDTGFMLDYIPDKCAECGNKMDSMYPYCTITESNTEPPTLTT